MANTASAASLGEQWAEKQSHRPDSNAHTWSVRAPRYGAKTTKNDYSLQFIERLALDEGDSVMDMGCGNGLIALPLAQAGHPVLACDFAQGMLDALQDGIAATGTTGITTKLLSWEEDWAAAGIAPDSVDVAFASRSVITRDMRDTLLKLTAVARKRCCATLGTGYAPKISAGILRDLGATTAPVRDFQFAFSVLTDEGLFPQVSYICNDRTMSFDTAEQACASLETMVRKSGPRDEAETARMLSNIKAWVDDHLTPNDRAGQKNAHGRTEGAFKAVIPNDIIWAFMSWSK